MRLQISIEAWCGRLLAALALAPVAGCGQSVDSGGTLIACENPTPLLAGTDTGYLVCEGGWMHREKVAACPSQLPRDLTCTGGAGTDMCTTDADCTESPNGFCADDYGAGCVCHYGCTTDADCGAGQICLCGESIGRCVASGCTSDADCGSGLCSTYVTNPDCGDIAFACQSTDDECAADADCGGVGMRCSMEGGHRACVEASCVIGRPFLVRGVDRIADVAARDDWRAAGWRPRIESLTAAQRDALAAHWTRVGLMEHASIAAFARFSLQLLAQGAPPELLRDTQAAMADETEHAALCFALASAYAGRGIGPGPLSIEGALEGDEPRAILVTAIREGCIGETVAAIEAAEAAQRALDPAVRRALTRISDDETRHAALAWRYVLWALERRPELGAVLAAEIDAALAECRSEASAAGDDEALLAFGVVGDGLRREIRRRALTQAIAPCARALLAKVAAGHRRVAADRLGSAEAGVQREAGEMPCAA